MGKNELSPGQSRVGFAWDTKITEPYTAMLRDRDGRVELVIPFDNTSNEAQRRYLGDLVTWGDDPDMSQYDYELPAQFTFADAHGFVCLVGVRRRTVDPLLLGPTQLAECVVDVEFAIFTGDPSVDYTRVNGIQADIQGLGVWFGHRSVMVPRRSRRGEKVTVGIRPVTTTRVDAGLNLSLVAGANWSVPGEPGLTSIEEVGKTETMVSRRRDLAEHLDRHMAIHELLELSAWKPLGFRKVQALHRRDPQRVLSGKPVGDRWAPVHTYLLQRETPNTGTPEFLFKFDDIGATGIRRWLRLREHYFRGLRAMTFSIRNRGTSLDGLISDAGIGLEVIGHQIYADRGTARRRSHHRNLEAIAAEVDALLPFDGFDWATRSTSVYNDVKHADRPDATIEEMMTSLRENRLVLRIWVARRLGVEPAVIQKHLWMLQR